MKTPRRSLLLCLPVLALSLAACGGPPEGDVALVKSSSGPNLAISQKQYDRFYGYELSGEQQKPVPQTTPLKAPDFKECVAAGQKLQADSQTKKPASTLKSACDTQYRKVRNNAMQKLLNLNWIKAETQRRGLTVRKSAINREMQTLIKSTFQNQAGYEKFLKETAGLTDADVRQTVYVQLAQPLIVDQLKEDVKAPTDADVMASFRQNKAQYVTPESRDLRVIKAKDEADAKAARAAIEAGKSWTETAKKYSTDALTKDTGGKIVGTTAAQQPVEFGGTAFKAKANTLLEPFKGADSWYVVYVGTITPEKQPDFKTLEPQLKEQLTQQGQTNALDEFKTLFLARWSQNTSCVSDFSDLVACGGNEGAAAATTPKLGTPPGAGVPAFPLPKVDPNAAPAVDPNDPAAQQTQQPTG